MYRLTIFLTTLYHCDTIFCDTLRGLQAYHQTRSNPCKSSISATFSHLLFIHHLKNVELQIVRLICCPQDRMIRRLCPELYLPQAFVYIPCCLPNGLCKKLIGHKMRAGTGCQKASVLYQLHGSQIDLTVALYSIFNGASGLGNESKFILTSMSGLKSWS